MKGCIVTLAAIVASAPAFAAAPPGLEAAIGRWAAPAAVTRFQFALTDLNGDALPDAVVQVTEPSRCGNGGCPLLVFKGTASGFDRVADSGLVRKPIYVLEERRFGWLSLGALAGLGNGERMVPIRFDGRAYASMPSQRVRIELSERVTRTALEFEEVSASPNGPAAAAPTAAAASKTAAAATEPHLLFGTWGVDVSKLPMPEPPRSVTVALADAGGGKVTMTVDIVDREGRASRATSTFTPDGTATPAVGSLDVDVVSMTMPNRRTLVMGAGMRGNPSNTRVWSLADDGLHMIETIVSHGPGNTPLTRTNTWTRLPSNERSKGDQPAADRDSNRP